ncbi:MAG TPA: hypothetical protein DCM08_12485, partial [Microscillaceae bacterium]|nr:hypothetical protein [Microscillaceae bacterium]
SPYIFEDLAVTILEENPELAQLLDDKKKQDEKFSQDAQAQLNFIYQRSNHYENTYKRYPIFRLNSLDNLTFK